MKTNLNFYNLNGLNGKYHTHHFKIAILMYVIKDNYWSYLLPKTNKKCPRHPTHKILFEQKHIIFLHQLLFQAT